MKDLNSPAVVAQNALPLIGDNDLPNGYSIVVEPGVMRGATLRVVYYDGVRLPEQDYLSHNAALNAAQAHAIAAGRCQRATKQSPAPEMIQPVTASTADVVRPLHDDRCQQRIQGQQSRHEEQDEESLTAEVNPTDPLEGVDLERFRGHLRPHTVEEDQGECTPVTEQQLNSTRGTRAMEIHPAANIFPLDKKTIPDLAKDIGQHGLIETVKLFEGKVIDGRRRLHACEKAGVEPRFEEVTPTDPIAYAWSLNGPRRHLSKTELALVGAKIRKLYDKEAKERQKAAAIKGNKSRHAAPSPVPVHLPGPAPDAGDSRDKVGKLVCVSGKTIDHATKVIEQGVPELLEAVEQGDMAVSAAAAIATETPEVQRAKLQEKRERKSKPAARKPHTKQPKSAHCTEQAAAAQQPASTPDAQPAVEPVAEPTADATTATQELPEDSPAERTARLGEKWHTLLHDLYRMTNGVRDAGGIEALAAGWSDEARQKNLAELRRLAGVLADWADHLHGEG